MAEQAGPAGARSGGELRGLMRTKARVTEAERPTTRFETSPATRVPRRRYTRSLTTCSTSTDTAAPGLGPRGLLPALTMPARRSRVAAAAAAALLAAGSVLGRFGVFDAGMASSRDQVRRPAAA